jgi:hypothetical protein
MNFFRKNKKKIVLILGAFVLCVFVRIVFSTGFVLLSDDIQYCKAAYQIYSGNFSIPTDHWMTRIGNNVSIAISYLVFGINEYSIYIASIFYSCLNIVLLIALSRELLGNNCVPFVYISLPVIFIFTPLSIYLGSTAHYAQGMTFFMFLSVYLYLLALKYNKIIYFLFSGLSIGIAYLFHTTGIYILLVFFVHSVVYKKLSARLMYIVLGFTIIFIFETAIYYAAVGKFIYRYEIINQTHLKKTYLYDTYSPGDFYGINDQLKRTLLQKSWLLQPFREFVTNPVYSILYILYFPINALLIFRKDKNIIQLNIIFWPLFLYISYGSTTPFSYIPMERLPRYTLPLLFPVIITISYGITKIISKKTIRYSVLAIFTVISIFCIAIKGGEMGQGFHQSKYFYKFYMENHGSSYVADNHTYNGILFLNEYKPLKNLDVIPTPRFYTTISDIAFIEKRRGAYIFVNYPKLYRHVKMNLGGPIYTEISDNERKKRKICYLPFFMDTFKNSICDLKEGGKILKIN